MLCHGCMNRQKWRMVSYLQHEIGLTVDGHTLNGTALWWFLGGDYMDSTGTGGGLYQSLVGPYYSCCLVICTLDVHCKRFIITIQYSLYHIICKQISQYCTTVINQKQINLYNTYLKPVQITILLTTNKLVCTMRL